MADVLIYTANFGRYDEVRAQPQQDTFVDWLCLTDEPDFKAPEPWATLPVLPAHAHPNLAAKVYKSQPPWELGDWTVAIWIDANMEITTPAFARECIEFMHDGCAFWRHPRRDCVYDEADASLGKESQGDRYENLPIAEQMAAYRAEGYPAHNGLFASGTSVWTREASSTLGRAWLDECEQWGFQDQLALPVVCWRLGVEPGVFGVHQIERRYTTRVTRNSVLRGDPYWLGNRWLRIHPHARPAYR